MGKSREPEKYEKLLLSTRAYDPKPFVTRLKELLKTHNESLREAALRSGLDHYAVNRFINQKRRPGMPACILLADHFELNPNELLVLAGWPRLKTFDLYQETAADLPPESLQIARDLALIPDSKRRDAAAVISNLLKLFH